MRALAGSSLLLTDGPDDVVKDQSQPVVIVAASLNQQPTSDTRDAFAERALASVGAVKDAKIERRELTDRGGASWSRIDATATDVESGKPLYLSQTIRFDAAGYIRTVGIAALGQRTALAARFREIGDSIAPR